MLWRTGKLEVSSMWWARVWRAAHRLCVAYVFEPLHVDLFRPELGASYAIGNGGGYQRVRRFEEFGERLGGKGVDVVGPVVFRR